MKDYQFEDLPLIQSLSTRTQKELRAVLQGCHYEPGETLMEEGSPGDRLLLLLSGSVSALIDANTSRERILGERTAGSFIGEMSLFTPEGKRTATIRANTPVSALALNYADLNQLMQTQPEVAFELMRTITRRLKSADDQAIAELRQKNIELEKAYADLAAAQAELVEKERLEKELEVARKIQLSILPPERPAVPGFTIGACIQPARAVGGDLFDFFNLPNGRIGISVGDVSDKGVPAGLFMARYCSLLRALSTEDLPPAETLTRANNLLIQRNEPGMFVTAIYGVLEPKGGMFRYARAGHELPLLFTANSEQIPVPHGLGQPLGIFEDAIMDTGEIQLDPGMVLFFNSDGASDATNPSGAYFGVPKLTTAIQDRLAMDAQGLCESLLEALNAYKQGSAQFDDVTLVAIKANAAT